VQQYEAARQVKMRLLSREQASMRQSPARAGGVLLFTHFS